MMRDGRSNCDGILGLQLKAEGLNGVGRRLLKQIEGGSVVNEVATESASSV